MAGGMSEPKNPNDAVDFILKQAGQFAKAKAERCYLDEFRKSKKALLMAQSDATAAVAREQYAYAHPEYLSLLDGLKAAIETEETLKWRLTAAQLSIEIWKTNEYSNRNQDRVMR